MLEPPAVGGAVSDFALARDGRSPGGQFGGALDEDEAGVVVGGVVQDAVGGSAVLFGAGDAGVEVRVFQIKEGQALFVSLLGVGLGVVDAADTGSEEVGGGQVPNGVVGRRLGVDQVGDPVLGVRMICLVNLDLKFAVVRA